MVAWGERIAMRIRMLRGISWSAGAAILAGLMVSGCGHSISVSSAGPAPAPPPGPEYVYVSNTGDNIISVFSVSAKTGVLTFVEQVQAEVGSGLKGIAANRAGTFLFAADPAASEILGFKIEQKTGKLTPTAQAVFPTGAGTQPNTLTITPGSTSLYVTDFANAQLFQFSFSSGSGELKPIGGGPVPTGNDPVSVAASSLGTAVFVANATDGTISGFSRANNGVLTPSGFIGSLGTSAGAPKWLAADLSGSRLYNADSLGGPGGSVVVFNITGSMLSLVGPFGTGNNVNGPLSVAINPVFAFVYAANDGNNNTSLYSITSTGLLPATLIPNTPSVNSVITDNLGKFLYLTDKADALVLQFAINSSSGAPTSIGSINTEVPPNGASSPFQIISVEEPSSAK
jgi:6-phosphogluconolactonase (cycloisomerase 2 family)